MVHYTRVQGLTDFPTEAREVAQAARDVGLRVGFAVRCATAIRWSTARTSRSWPRSRRGRACEIKRRFLRPPLPVAEQVARSRRSPPAAASPTFDVQYGPQACNGAATSCCGGSATASARTGRRIHMHLLETRYQRDWADATYPGGIVQLPGRASAFVSRGLRSRIASGRGPTNWS